MDTVSPGKQLLPKPKIGKLSKRQQPKDRELKKFDDPSNEQIVKIYAWCRTANRILLMLQLMAMLEVMETGWMLPLAQSESGGGLFWESQYWTTDFLDYFFVAGVRGDKCLSERGSRNELKMYKSFLGMLCLSPNST